MKIRILFIITHLALGGAQKQLLSLIQNLDKDKYDLFLCAGGRGRLRGEFEKTSLSKTYFIAELVRIISPLNDLIAFVRIYLLIRNNRFDIVHTHSPKASILGRWAAFLAGVRNIVYTVHGWSFHDFLNPLSRYLYVSLEKFTALVTKKIIVVSSSDLRKGLEEKVSTADKFVIIHYGVSAQRAESIFLQRKARLSFESLVINISCLKRQKGLIHFLDAVQMIQAKRRDITFFIVGDGPLKESIKREIEKRKLSGHVLLKGWVNDVSQLLSRASLLVITSLWEGLPLAVIEAVASGLPVVATDTGGVLDILDNDNSIVLQRKNAQGIADAVLDIMDNDNRWHKRAIAARDNFDLTYWSDKRMTQLTEKVYQEVLVT
ncbi:MAG: glycosyltransferase family 4 protein [Candidatus Orphnella occulta]|nr:glycosyltransferase family 4 protein [Candidatus Orphnella occulta]